MRHASKGKPILAVSTGVPPSTDIIDVVARIAAIRKMRHGPLKELYQKHFGDIPATHNAKHLRRKLAARIQLDAIPPEERERLELLEPKALEMLRRRVEARRQAVAKVPMDAGSGQPIANDRRKPNTPTVLRDPRLPPPGTVLTKRHQADTHQVTIHQHDFEWNGRRWASLSKIAYEITGTKWNGLLYFGLVDRKPAQRKEASHA